MSAPGAVLYRRVLGVIVDAKERFQVHLRPDDVLSVLRQQSQGEHDQATASDLTIDTVTSALEQLVDWGNLLSSPDTGRVVRVEDFYRKRQLFQLSHAGEAVERALQTYDEALGRRGALQAVALDDIAATLREFLDLAGAGSANRSAPAKERATTAPDPDALDLGKLQQSLLALTARFNDLAGNASAFMASLQRTIDLTDTDEDVFLAYKSRLIDYLDRFIHDLAVRSPQIAAMLSDADFTAVDRVLRLLAERDAAASAPGLDGDDGQDAAHERDRRHTFWLDRWTGLQTWFLSTGGRDSQAKLLRLSALAAIPALLDAVREVNARRSGRSDRSADYLSLARWFNEAESDDDRHRLARAAFGLYSARHLTVTPETWDRWQDQAGLVGVAWADAPPLEISPQLRRTGSYERKGRPNQVIDRSADRAALALRVKQQAEQIAAARRRLATDETVELQELAGLDSMAFGLFLNLLGDALVSKRPEAHEINTLSSDGTMSIDLTPIADDALVELHTERGILRGPNHLVRIRDLVDPIEPRVDSTVAAHRSARRDDTDDRLEDAS